MIDGVADERERDEALKKTLIAVLIWLAATASPVSAASGPAPRAVVDSFHAALLHVMRSADALGAVGRYQFLEPRVRDAFDLERMIRVASGAHWRGATPAQKANLLEAFTQLSVSTYASRFDGYSGQTFEIEGERPGPRNSVLVDTRINRPGESAVPITYVLNEKGGHWRIINVILDRSISELAVRRSEYSRVLERGGPTSLAAALRAKAGRLLPE